MDSRKYRSIISRITSLKYNSDSYKLLELAQQQLKNSSYKSEQRQYFQLNLKYLNYHEMKKYLNNKNEYLKFNITEPPKSTIFAKLQEKQQPSEKQFVSANQLVPKKRFQPPTKTNDLGSKSKQQIQQLKLNNNNCEDSIISRIEQDIIEISNHPILWSDIVGLDHVRDLVVEIALWPLENPMLFDGITSPGNGVLLFGPPGTGKTMIGKAIASEGRATFFSVKASTLTSKYVGDGEKAVRALFTLAQQRQPSVIFFDEIDSLLCQRSEKENEASRSIKTEFMVQLEGTNKSGQDRIVFIGATNRPQELDDAIKRRFQKRIYIPLPNREGREQYFNTLIAKEQEQGKSIQLSNQDVELLIKLTKGFSGADVRNLCREACMYAIRDAAKQYSIKEITKDKIRETTINDFKKALSIVKPTVNQSDLKDYLIWNQQFGSYNYDAENLDT